MNLQELIELVENMNEEDDDVDIIISSKISNQLQKLITICDDDDSMYDLVDFLNKIKNAPAPEYQRE